MPARSPSVAVVGGGFTGSLFALKMAAAAPDWTVFLIESRQTAGRGLAYGACGPDHLLNVPVHRMEVGCTPSFENWLRPKTSLITDALKESSGSLRDAFVPRYLFGDYMQERVAEALKLGKIRLERGEAVRMGGAPRQIVLAGAKTLPADIVVLATGNLPSQLPFDARESDRIIIDPWQTGVLDGIRPNASLLLIGSGLTMVDILLALQTRGHKGPLHVVSRHGRLPMPHRSGGNWPGFLDPALSPRQVLRSIRENIRLAEERGIPWQRVFDAARPVAASVWHRWSLGQRAQFLRHLRTLWDVHRHRMAERVAALVEGLLRDGALQITAGRVLAIDEYQDGLTAMIRPRGKKALTVEVDAIINCTGPHIDMRNTDSSLVRDLFHQGFARSDPLGLGFDTKDCAVNNTDGEPSDWLFALGPPTRPEWWEITAVPEINAQVERLVLRLAQEVFTPQKSLTEAFVDIGGGI